MGLTPESKKKALYATIAGAGAVPLLILYATIDPESSSLFPQCLFHRLTGLRCTFCGFQRALHSTLNLDFAQAFHHNAFLIISLPILALLALSVLLRKRIPKLYALFSSKALIATLLLLVLLWFLLRNLLGI